MPQARRSPRGPRRSMPLTTTQWIVLSAMVRAIVTRSASGGHSKSPSCIASRTVASASVGTASWNVAGFVVMADAPVWRVQSHDRTSDRPVRHP